MSSFQIESLNSKSAPEAGSGGSDGHASNGGWLMDDIVHPLVNAGFIEPYNVVSNIADGITGTDALPHCDLLSTPEAKSGSAAWFAQSISGGVGSLVPFVAAGELTGGIMKGGGRMLEATSALDALDFGGATSKFLASDRAAAVIGAGLYGGAREPQDGQSRIGNAIGTMAAFGAFEYGNKLTAGMSLGASIPLRAMVGAAGGLSQLEVSHLIANHSLDTSSNALQAMVSGGALNVLLPAAQKGVRSVEDTAATALGRPISAESFAARQGWTGSSDSTGNAGGSDLSALIEKAPLTRVKTVTGDTSIDQNANLINFNPRDGEDGFTHELAHRIGYKAGSTGSLYDQAASRLKSDPEQAWQTFRT
ncbi:MAG TPA: hypothetical protein V6C72_11740, partial [Chroococcales cyanobacterium]